MSDDTKPNKDQPQLPKGPRIEPDADSRNRNWLLRAPMFRYRRPGDMRGGKQPNPSTREE